MDRFRTLLFFLCVVLSGCNKSQSLEQIIHGNWKGTSLFTISEVDPRNTLSVELIKSYQAHFDVATKNFTLSIDNSFGCEIRGISPSYFLNGGTSQKFKCELDIPNRNFKSADLLNRNLVPLYVEQDSYYRIMKISEEELILQRIVTLSTQSFLFKVVNDIELARDK